MSLKVDRVQLEIVINNDQARKQMRALDEEARKLTSEMKKLDKTSAEYAQKADRLKSIKVQMDNIYESIGVNNMTMRELTTRQKDLNAVLLHMRPGTAEYVKLKDEVNAVKQRISELNGKAKSTGVSLKGMAEGFNRYFGMVTAFAASFAGVVIGFKKMGDMANKYGESVANLSALTGLAGDDLQWLSNQAKDVAKNGTDAGIKITSGAQAIVDAYTLMGSAKPELLKNKEALDQVTQSALIMADAAKIEAAEAVDSLANTMNQFNAPAAEANKYINVLAAGSKEGAAAIPSISASMVKFGAAAASANISVEESVALIEALAEKGLKGELAGTQIKTALLKMQTGADDTNPKIVGLQTALENLRNKNLSAAEMVKFFGQESYVAAQILLQNTDRVEYFTKAVTGTNIAIDQATVNTETNAAALKRAQNRFELMAITIGEKLAPALTFSTNGLTYLAKALIALPDFIRRNEISIIGVVGALIAWRAAQLKSIATSVIQHASLQTGIGLKIKDAIVLQALVVKEELATIWKSKSTVASKLATTAQYAWNAAIAANPIGVAVLAITAMVAAIKLWDRNNTGAIEREREKNMVLNESDRVISSLNKKLTEQKSQIERLNQLSLTEKQDLREKIQLSVDYTKAKLLELQAREEELRKDNTRTTAWQTLKNGILSFGNGVLYASKQTSDAIQNGLDATEPITSKIKELDSQLKQFEQTASTLDNVLQAESMGDKIGTKSIAELEEKIRMYGIALRSVNTESEDYTRISSKISEVNALLKKQSSDLTDGNNNLKDSYSILSEEISNLQQKLRLQVQQGASQSVIDSTLDAINKLEQKKGTIDSMVKFYTEGVNFFDQDFQKKSEQQSERDWNAIVAENDEALGNEMSPLMNQARLEADYKLRLARETADGQRAIFAQQLKDNLISQTEYNDKIKQINLAELQTKMDLWSKALGNMQSVFGESTLAYKVIASARAGIDTYMAATAALAPPPEGAGPLLGPILAASTIAMGLANVAQINGIKIGQRAKGKYDVIGAEDGKRYSATYTGRPETRIYSKPTLIAEQGEELVVDAATTKNLMMNYPGIVEAIYAARVPQLASGNIPENAPSYIDSGFIEAITRLNTNLEQGIRGKWFLYDLEDAQDKLSKIKSNSTF